MIGLDTNVLLRLFDDSDLDQRARVHALVKSLGEGGCYLNVVVLSEFAWTLNRAYKRPRPEIAAHLRSLLEAPEFVVSHHEEAMRAIGRYLSGGASFPDYFIAEINSSAGCSHTATFDRDALNSGDPFTAVPPSQ